MSCKITGILFVMLFAGFMCSSHADILWRGDFETGDFGQWSYLLNPDGVRLSSEHRAEGRYSAHITVTGGSEYLWNNDPALNRVELQHKPGAERTADGSDLYIGWSFMLPRLFTRSRHEFGYWESSESYRQIMRFNISGADISFQTNMPEKRYWNGIGRISPGTWHDIAMHIHWSCQPEYGYVSIWFDGEEVLSEAAARTLISDDEAMFIQLGILRDQSPVDEEIYIDGAIEASSLREVLDFLNQL